MEYHEKILHLPTGNTYIIFFQFPSAGVIRKTSLVSCPGVSCHGCPLQLPVKEIVRNNWTCHGKEVPVEQFESIRK